MPAMVARCVLLVLVAGLGLAPADPAAKERRWDSLVVSENFARMMLANTNAGCRERRPAAFRDPTPAAGTRVHRDG